MKAQAKLFFYSIIFLTLLSCTSSVLKYKKSETFFKNEEFENAVKIESNGTDKPAIITTETAASVSAHAAETIKLQAVSKPALETKSTANNKNQNLQPALPKEKKHKLSKNKKSEQSASSKTMHQEKRQPDIEDTDGFVSASRRPTLDPFKPGEKVIHAVKYFTAEAGRLTLEVKPYAQVNGQRSYQFAVGLKSSRLFSNFYSVDDQVDTFLDFESLVPYVLKINIKETGKLAQAQSVFDHKNLTAKFWEKKYTTKNGEEEKKYEWDIVPFSQNAYSGLFYMRIFNWKVGKEISFHVAEDEKNIVFKGTAIAKETLETEAGTFQAFKIKASILSRGALTQTGDVYIWISDDERKYILRIEAKIKIGSLVSEIVELHPGS